MNIAPNEFIKLGILAKEDVDEEQMQQVGMDLRVKAVRNIGHDVMLPHDSHWRLQGLAAYELELCEVKMPKDCFGYIIGRSSFNRKGVLIRSSVIDPGYHGLIGVTAYPMISSHVKVAFNERVGQLIVFKANVNGQYNGQYQNERLPEKDKK